MARRKLRKLNLKELDAMVWDTLYVYAAYRKCLAAGGKPAVVGPEANRYLFDLVVSWKKLNPIAFRPVLTPKQKQTGAYLELVDTMYEYYLAIKQEDVSRSDKALMKARKIYETCDARKRDIKSLFGKTKREISELGGPKEAARKTVARKLGLGARTYYSIKERERSQPMKSPEPFGEALNDDDLIPLVTRLLNVRYLE